MTHRLGDGAWIFLSHSTKDWATVRRIRNVLEELGHKPLTFFLKSVTDQPELDDLIQREIEARTWFLLCGSPNAAESSWVQAEIRMVKELRGKAYEELDLGAPLEQQLERVHALSRRATVLLMYASADRAAAERIAERLLAHDVRVWLDLSSLSSAADWTTAASLAIDEAVRTGFVLVLLSQAALTSRWVAREIEYALNKCAATGRTSNVVPVIVDGGPTIVNGLPPALRGLQVFDVSSGQFDERVRVLAESPKVREME